MQTGQATVSSRSRPQQRSGRIACIPYSAPLARDFGRELARLARGPLLPDAGRIADEDLGRAIDPLHPTNATRYSCRKDGNPAREARCLRSADLAFDQSLECSDQDCHTGSLAPEGVERQTKGEDPRSIRRGFRASRSLMRCTMTVGLSSLAPWGKFASCIRTVSEYESCLAMP
jgi:hypothetical protein